MRIVETTLHELVHVLVDSVGGRTNAALVDGGMAIYVAGEGKMIAQRAPTSIEKVEHALASARSAGDMQTACAGAYNLVRRLVLCTLCFVLSTLCFVRTKYKVLSTKYKALNTKYQIQQR